MTAPRHLWSGDWQNESSAHAEDLATRRTNAHTQPESEPEPETRSEPAARPPRRRRPSKNRRRLRDYITTIRAWTRRQRRVALLAAFLTLLIAGAAYAVISDSGSTNKPQPVVSSGTEAWLGVELANAPVRGALVAKVVPGSPAAKAGIRPGDLITQLDTEPIGASATFVAAISGMQPGDAVDIQLQRGASEYAIHVKLGSRSVGTP